MIQLANARRKGRCAFQRPCALTLADFHDLRQSLAARNLELLKAYHLNVAKTNRTPLNLSWQTQNGIQFDLFPGFRFLNLIQFELFPDLFKKLVQFELFPGSFLSRIFAPPAITLLAPPAAAGQAHLARVRRAQLGATHNLLWMM